MLADSVVPRCRKCVVKGNDAPGDYSARLGWLKRTPPEVSNGLTLLLVFGFSVSDVSLRQRAVFHYINTGTAGKSTWRLMEMDVMDGTVWRVVYYNGLLVF